MKQDLIENNLKADKTQTIDRRNFFGGLWHGAFLALAVALTQPTTVISSFVVELTGSTIWVGGLSTVLVIASTLPQLFIARLIENRKRKMPYLLLGIYLRVISWAVLAWMIFLIGADKPETLAWVLIIMLAVFYASGGLASIPYTDIIGKVIPSHRRGAFFGGKQALAGPLAVGAAFIAQRILANLAYPDNYGMLFGLASLVLGMASLGFWMIKEPDASIEESVVRPWSQYWKQLKTASKKLKQLVLIEILTGFSLMSLPFYVVFAREKVNAPLEATGWYLLAQVLGGILANLIWAALVDRAGSRKMLATCALVSTLIPILALGLAAFGWAALLPVFFLVGAIVSGRSVGFQSALLELAPDTERPTFSGLNQVLILPIAFLSLIAGVFLEQGSYSTLFIVTSLFVGAGAVVAVCWVKQDANLPEGILSDQAAEIGRD